MIWGPACTDLETKRGGEGKKKPTKKIKKEKSSMRNLMGLYFVRCPPLGKKKKAPTRGKYLTEVWLYVSVPALIKKDISWQKE